ncbi:hypothetical protein G6F43_003846 [Rhizopus delemar]|nr:hypothetical protein G6F43_003846 [Rhizopus delemar]
MKPQLQRIVTTSLLSKSSRHVLATTSIKRTVIRPKYIPPSKLPANLQISSCSFHTSKAATYSIPTSEEEEEKEEQKSNFEFIASAAWHPKSPKRQTQSKKTIDAGEDAFFQTTTPQGLAIGVADGVGGWSTMGVDPALFSWTLMNNASNVASKSSKEDAHDILDVAFDKLRKSGKVSAGSSTACILNLSKTTGEMTSCNLGDSAFVLVRDKKIVYESPSQQHYFNCPYQLTVVPRNYPNRDEFVTDLPKDGDRKTFYLKNGDLILLATDGYFDNVYAEETLDIINACMESIEDKETMTKTLAKTLTEKARKLSLDPKRISPWAKAARAQGANYRGGKVDDITCIVTLVCHNKI